MNNVSQRLGYASPRYAYSLREFGELRELSRSGGWILVRPIPGTPFKDATGCYPLFACRDWKGLQEDLERISPDLVSLVVVADPFSGIDKSHLEQCFDFVKPFKTHYLAELNRPLESAIDRSYRYNIRKSLKTMEVEICEQPSKYLNSWLRLYDNLIARHSIKGITAFSHASFAAQLSVPGMTMVLGRSEGEVVGAMLILARDNVAYSHLTAFSNKGYKMRAAYGIYWTALCHLRDRGIRTFDIGGSAGIREEDKLDGLGQFKKGWSNTRRQVFICGRVFDRETYDLFCKGGDAGDIGYFPAYRLRESKMALVSRRGHQAYSYASTGSSRLEIPSPESGQD